MTTPPIKPASPLPWRQGSPEGYNIVQIQTEDGKETICEVSGVPLHTHLDELEDLKKVAKWKHGLDNATYIVTAANSYPELVRQNGELREALKQASALLDHAYDICLRGSYMHRTYPTVNNVIQDALLSSLKTEGSPKDVLGHAVTETNPVG